MVVHGLAYPESSTVASANDHTSGRQVRDGLTNLGSEGLKHITESADLFRYRTQGQRGNPLVSSSIGLREGRGRPFAALCLNGHVQPLLLAAEVSGLGRQRWTPLRSLRATSAKPWAALLTRRPKALGKPVELLTREERIRMVRRLDERGVFLIKHGVERVAAYLGRPGRRRIRLRGQAGSQRRCLPRSPYRTSGQSGSSRSRGRAASS